MIQPDERVYYRYDDGSNEGLFAGPTTARALARRIADEGEATHTVETALGTAQVAFGPSASYDDVLAALCENGWFEHDSTDDRWKLFTVGDVEQAFERMRDIVLTVRRGWDADIYTRVPL